MVEDGQNPQDLQNQSMQANPTNPVVVVDNAHELGKENTVDEAIDRCRDALAKCPPGHPDRALKLDELAGSLCKRYIKVEGLADLDEAVQCQQEALCLRPPGHPDHATSLGYLGTYLKERFQRVGNLADADAAISYEKETLTIYAPGHRFYAMSLDRLVVDLENRYLKVKDLADLDSLITHDREALALRPPGHPGRSYSIGNLGVHLAFRFKEKGELDDLNSSIQCKEEDLALCSLGDPDRSKRLSNVAVGLLTRYQRFGDLADLNTAIRYGQDALDLRLPDTPERATALQNLAVYIYTRFERKGDLADLDMAIKYAKEVLGFRQPGDPARAQSLVNLGGFLAERFQHVGDLVDISTAVQYGKEALALRPHGHPDRMNSLLCLMTILPIRYSQVAELDDLNTAVLNGQEALALQSPGSPRRAVTLSHLASCLRNRFEHSGERADLDTAIQYDLEAVALCPSGHPSRGITLVNLASHLGARYQKFGDLEDLDSGIQYQLDALATSIPGHPYRAVGLSNLAVYLVIRFDQIGERADLDTAIQYHEDALALRPPGHPDRGTSLSNLAEAIGRRFKQSGDRGDLDVAIQYKLDARTLCPPAHPHRAPILSDLSELLRLRFEHAGDRTDLERAIAYAQDARSLCPRGNQSRVEVLGNLVRALVRQRLGDDAEDVHEKVRPDEDVAIISLFDEICNQETGNIDSRLSCAFEWVSFARKTTHPSTSEAYDASLELLNLWVTIARSLESQHSRFSAKDAHSLRRGVVEDATAWALAQQQPRKAVEILEQGRGILFTELGHYRTPLDDLPDRKLAARFAELSSRMESSLVSSQTIGTDGAESRQKPFIDEVAIHHRRSSEWKETINLIRSTEGFSDFLLSPSYAKLAHAASEGPVVMINLSQYRSDAIILHQGSDPEVVELPLASLDSIEQIAIRLSKAVDEQSLSTASKVSEIEVSEVLRLLWECIASPVVERLRKRKVAPGSRIWLCPTSILCSMPLHAAGIYTPGSKGCRLPDVYISSYIPTLSALIRARRSQQTVLTSWKMLAVGVANPGQREKTEARLVNVGLELDQIGKCARSSSLKRMEGQEATHSAVLERLPEYSWIHLACHGFQNLKKPFDSRFSLQDKPLTLLEIVHAHLPNAEFAFLSACHSAKGDPTAPDEALHLAAALHFVGFRSVVGTLWAMDDRDGPEVAEVFYKHMFGNDDGGDQTVDFRSAAKGVFRIAAALRRKQVRLHRWINFVHVGA